jgi:hypothetical protein
VELSNNLAENSMRPVELGRKTGCMWTARRPAPKWPRFFRSWNPGVPVTEYFIAVLPGLGQQTLSEIANPNSSSLVDRQRLIALDWPDAYELPDILRE